MLARLLQQQSFARKLVIANSFPMRNADRGGSRSPVGRMVESISVRRLQLVDIALMPAYHRRGIGGELLRRLFAEGRGASIGLHVSTGNPARRLYETVGFRSVSNNLRICEWSTRDQWPFARFPSAQGVHHLLLSPLDRMSATDAISISRQLARTFMEVFFGQIQPFAFGITPELGAMCRTTPVDRQNQALFSPAGDRTAERNHHFRLGICGGRVSAGQGQGSGLSNYPIGLKTERKR